MTAPSEDEKGLLVQFRDRVKDTLKSEEDQSDHFLLRWIRARDHNLETAEQMLRDSFKWRQENKVDSVLDLKVDSFYPANYPYWIEGLDKQGHPVVEVPVGSWDLRKAIQHGTEDHFLHYSNQLFERIMLKIRQSGKSQLANGEWPNTLVLGIVDWKGYSYSQLMHYKAVQNLMSLISRYEAYYPEIVFKLVFINCPSIFNLLFKLLKPLFAPRTLDKISIYGSNKEEWQLVLKELIHPDQFGKQFGGNCQRI